jgi:hypothetical protein
MRYPGPALLWLALWLGAWTAVRAEPAPALVLELQGPVPFERDELADALLPRLTDASIETRAAARGAVVQVSAAGDGVLVRVGTRERTVSLGQRTGAGAARVVALVLMDLMLSEGPALPMPLALPPASPPARDTAGDADATGDADADADAAGPVARTATDTPLPPAPAARPAPLAFEPPPLPPVPAARPPVVGQAPLAPPGAVARPAAAPVAAQEARRSPGAAPARAVTRVRLSGLGGTMLRAASEGTTLASAGADVRLGRGRWRAGLGLAWLHLPTTSYDRTDIALDGASVRLDAGRAFGNLELTATAFAMPSRLYTDTGARAHHDSLLLGGGAALRAGARLTRRWLLVASAGIDVFGRRLRVRTVDEVIASTPLVTISLAVGVSWEVLP